MSDVKLQNLEIRRLTIQTDSGPYTYSAVTGMTIENITKPGQYCDIPWYRVSDEDQPIAEFPAHNVIGVYFCD